MINLLPPKRLVDLHFARTNTVLARYIQFIMISIIVLAIIIMGAYYFLNNQKKSMEEIITADNEKIAELQPYQEKAENLSQTINTVSNLLSRDVRFSQMLVQIGGLMPNGAVLTGLQLSVADLEAPLVVSADTDTEERAAVLLNNLNSSTLFERAEIQSVQEIKKQETPAASSTPPTVSADNAPSPAPTTPAKPVSPYNYVVTLNVYLKKITKEKTS